MEKSNKRGKIPQADWPLIMARYEAGETLASIARTYDCSPPAISYVVSRSRVRQVGDGPAAGPSVAEPQLIKAADMSGPVQHAEAASGADASSGLPARADLLGPLHQFDVETPALPTVRPGVNSGDPGDRDAAAERRPNGGNGAAKTRMQPGNRTPFEASAGRGPGSERPVNGSLAAVAGQRAFGSANGADQRRTLHLSLGGPANGAARHSEYPAGGPDLPSRNGGTGQIERVHDPARSAAGVAGASEIGPVFEGSQSKGGKDLLSGKEGGTSFIDQQLRARVDADIAAFLAAFDAALLEDTQENRSSLREMTDRLLRAGARTRIELERLEAKIPLPSRDGRDGRGADPAAWRYR